MFKSPNSADAANNNNHNMETENETETETRFRLKSTNESNSRQLLAITAGFIIIPLLKCRSTIQKRILDTLMTLICRASHSINQAKRLLLRIIPLKISETLFSLWIFILYISVYGANITVIETNWNCFVVYTRIR